MQENVIKRNLKFVNLSNNEDPFYASENASGFDIRAWIKDDDANVLNNGVCNYIELQPLERRNIHSGLYFDIPKGLEIQVRPRSGTSIKKGLTLINCVGTIDSDYTGEICLLMVNVSNEKVIIENGERIVQCVLMPVFSSENVNLTKVDNINKETVRGEGGLGHTGNK